jgi:hypothetical protein
MLNQINKSLADPRFCFISLLTLALTMIGTPFIASAFIEGATRKQCLNRDWPADKHAVHMDFCNAYGYPTK